MKKAIIFTGLIRDEKKFISFLDTHIARTQYKDIPFYFSSWLGELEKYPEVAARLKKLNAIYVEQNQPDLVLPGHALHQMVTWDLPFGLLENDVFVYKSRPDFADYSSFERFFQYTPVETSASSVCNTLPRYKFIISSLFLAQPFYINDITFAGMAGDLRRLTKLSLLDMVKYLRLGPEQLIWAPQFIETRSVLDIYFKGNIGLIFNDEKKSLKNIERLKGYPAYIFSLAFYFIVIRDAFDFFETENSSYFAEMLKGYSAEDFLWEALDLPFLVHHPSCSNNRTNIQNYVSAIIDGSCRPSKFQEDLKCAITNIQNRAPLPFDFLNNEAEEYDLFCTKELDIHGSKVVRKRAARIFITGAGAGWQQANLGTSVTQKLEVEINQLRRTINQLEAQVNFATNAAMPK